MSWLILKSKSIPKSKIIIFLIILFSFLAPLVYSFVYRIAPVVDALAYDKIAINLLEGRGFKEEADKSYEFDLAIVRAGPAYEFFLAGVYAVFGHHYEIVWILQAFLHAVSAYLIFLSCREIFKEKGDAIGLIAATLFGLHPDLIEISAMLMTETTYLFLIVLVIWLFIKLYQKSEQIRYSVFLSFATGLAILSRPPVILFIPIILIFYILNKKYKQGAVFLALLILTLLPWVIRNYFIYHQFILTTLIGEYNLWVGNTLLANGGQISSGYNPLTSYTEVNGFFTLKQQAGQEFWSFVIAYPFVFVKLCLIRIVRYFSLIRPMGFWFYQTGIKQIIFVFSSVLSIAVLFVVGFSGMAASLKEKKPFFYYFIALAFTSPLVLIPTVVQSRYRFQIYPLLAIFGGYFLVNFFTHKSGYKKNFVIVGSVLLAISLIDLLLFLPTILERLRYLIIF